ncbi:MAG: FlgD immunoglobulin-like domain containing protein [Candidatus Cloacimonadaceae bacterium]|nr:FlgD immunoglobulin-like domain containing protein [Candidatus Cloacimonadaceae bacterium]MDP3115322.1 FlgD immunoglobulin-like domain containing protein [Candidatus Cloacimonadaceae bacterium]
MKYILITILLLLILPLAATLPPEWRALQRDLGIQAAQYKDTPEHQALRERTPRHYNVGDTQIFWRWNLSVMPPLWIQTSATCRAVGEHCYIFVADSEWNVHMTQGNVDTILFRLEDSTVNDPTQGAIEMDIGLFGPIPDELDNDPRLIVFYSALGSFQGTSFDGYFSPYNQVTEAQAQQMNPPGHSNECEMIYMTCYPLSPVTPIRLSVLAHELAHLIHWGQDANEETWLNEGCAELAMVVYGIPDPITGFPSAPDNNLTAWNQTFADYVKVMLFFTYLQEHYDSTGMIRSLVENPSNGIVSLIQEIAIHYPNLTFADIFCNWNIANALDRLTPGEGLYNYAQLALPSFTMTSLNTSPALNNQTIQPYAADYLKYNVIQPASSFSLQSNFPIRVSTLIFDSPNNCTEVREEGTGTFFFLDPVAAGAYRVNYVLSNPTSSSITYSYTSVVSNDDNVAPVTGTALTGNSPNPFKCSTNISYNLKENLPVRIDIFNSRGQKVRTLVDNNQIAGTHSTAWNGKDDNRIPVSAGVYLYRLTAGTYQSIRRMSLLPTE